MAKRQLKLGLAAYNCGWDKDAWRLPESANVGLRDPSVVLDIARIAERGKLDFVFAGSSLATEPRRWDRIYRWDNSAYGGFAAAQTKNVGFLLTYNTSFEHPFFVARQLATLDIFSGGRIAFNAVTGIDRKGATANFSNWPLPDEESKYTRVAEFTEVLYQLLYSWDEDFLLDDKEGGQLIRPGSWHAPNHQGEHFLIKGPLNTPRPVQQIIPNMHVGTSEKSVAYGVQYAHARFAVYSGHDANKKEYARQKALISARGRDPDKFKILPGISIYIGATAREAREKFRQIQEFTLGKEIPEAIGRAVGVELTGVKPSERFFSVVDIEKIGSDSLKALIPQAVLHRQAERDGERSESDDREWLITTVVDQLGEDMTLADLYQFVLNRRFAKGLVIGDAKRFADFLEEGLEDEVFDGVQLFPPYHRGPAELFVDLVVPELQRRGIFRTEYEGRTLAENLGVG